MQTNNRAAVDFYLDDVGMQMVASEIRAHRERLALMRAHREARELVRAIQITCAVEAAERQMVIR
jgi:hypothetical protein